jgi:acetyl-CoA carboxylase biotin carboxyl carrier protein
MNYNELQDFIKTIAKSGATEVNIETDEIKLTIKAPPKGKQPDTIVQQLQIPAGTQGVVPQLVSQAAAPVATSSNPKEQSNQAKEDTSNLIEIKAPMVGTFYRKPGPDKPSFVNVGDMISEGQVICILEAMKLFNEIEAEISGKIVKVLVDDATPIEFDQTLFLVDPS